MSKHYLGIIARPARTRWYRDLRARFQAAGARLYKPPLPPRDTETEAERLGALLECDRSTVADGVAAVKRAIRRREWLRLGRGSYEYDDDRWKDEFGEAIDEILAALKPLQKVASNWDGCPSDRGKIARARALAARPGGEGRA